ncbi:MAG TPA: lipid-binding SYLF domain-containing protein [Candidatus Sulfotelmatobacter sp.]|jgi:lipid-binding SYLF domain-containing protein|nr:lipid-binding SYLF domain-containing protein [Candidatus Sulfotelmatobacter sp.]
MRAARITTMAAAIAISATAALAASEQVKLQRAEAVLKAALEAPDRGIPKDALEKAECVGVFPDVKKGAFIVGGEGGSGVFTCRGKDGMMGAPAFFKLGGASVGWQFGGQETDLVLLVMNQGGMSHLLKDHVTLGAEAVATAGPVGRTLKAATDAQLHAEILSWSRSQGAFLGAALDGSVLKPDGEANTATYGKGATAKSILVDHKSAPPAEAVSFLKTLNASAARG